MGTKKKSGINPWMVSTFVLVGIVIGVLFSQFSGFFGGKNVATTVDESGIVRIPASVDDDPVLGSQDAPITMIEFSDYQCPYCNKFFTNTLPQIKRDYIDTGKVKLVYRDYPLSFHQYAQITAEAAECAGEQTDYFDYHDLIFQRQSKWSVAEDIQSLLSEYAAELGLDIQKFSSCLSSGKYTAEVQQDFNDGRAYEVTGTPGFFINGREVKGAQGFQVFADIFNEELALIEKNKKKFLFF